MYTFHLFGPTFIPFIKNRDVDAHTSFLLKFAKLFKSKGHKIILYGFGPNLPKYYYSEYVRFPIGVDMKLLNHPDIFTSLATDQKIIDYRGTTKDKYTEHVTLELPKRYMLNHIIGICGNDTVYLKDTYKIVEIMNFGSRFYMTPRVVFCSATWRNLWYDEIKQGLKNDTIIRPWIDVSACPLGASETLIENATCPFNTTTQKEKFTFLYLARCSQIKGFGYFMQVAKHFSLYKFLVAGPISEVTPTTLIDTYMKYEKSDYPNVTYLGVLSRKAKFDILSKVTALIQPSRYNESFGLNVIEALACGTPVITSCKGTFVETVKHGEVGFILPEHCTWDLVNTYLTKCHEIDPSDCRHYVKKHFSEDVAYKKYMEFFKDISQNFKDV